MCNRVAYVVKRFSGMNLLLNLPSFVSFSTFIRDREGQRERERERGVKSYVQKSTKILFWMILSINFALKQGGGGGEQQIISLEWVCSESNPKFASDFFFSILWTNILTHVLKCTLSNQIWLKSLHKINDLSSL